MRCVFPLFNQRVMKMATTKISVSFLVLSNISCEGDVFDHLLKVRRLDTGEEGLLLCSHYCRWPADLVNKATWLEGCFTPAEYKDDPRLVLGAHPGSVTSWGTEVKADGSVVLEVYVSLWEEDIPVDLPLPLDEWVNWESYYPRRRVLDRLWRNAENHSATIRGALEAYYRQVVTLVQGGAISPIVGASYVPKGMSRTTRDQECEFTQGCVWGDAGWYCVSYYNYLKVVVEAPEEGYIAAVPLSIKPTNPYKVVWLDWEPPIAYTVSISYGPFKYVA